MNIVGVLFFQEVDYFLIFNMLTHFLTKDWLTAGAEFFSIGMVLQDCEGQFLQAKTIRLPKVTFGYGGWDYGS